LVNKFQEAGIYRIKWDGKDRFGQDVPSGVYFYQLQAGGMVQTKKLVVVK
jgi:hypothetical protein